jgi:ATP-dependent helicase HrpB
LPRLLASLEQRLNAVLVAPPGAGKTTLAPLALLDGPGCLAKSCCWSRVDWRPAPPRAPPELVGEEVGQTVGYAMRWTRAPPQDALVVTESTCRA